MKILRLDGRSQGKKLIITLNDSGTAVIEIDFYDNGTKEGFICDKKLGEKLREFFKEQK